MALPAEGDVRLVPLVNATSGSAACDAVHRGVVQIFLDGVWGLLCTSSSSRIQEDTGFDLDAKVICGQLGFQFGTRFDSGSAGRLVVPEDVYDYDYSSLSMYSAFPTETQPLDDVPVFATRITCTGKESRVDQCVLPEREPSFTSFDPAPGPGEIGVRAACEQAQGTRLAVACRQFEIQGELHACYRVAPICRRRCCSSCIGSQPRTAWVAVAWDALLNLLCAVQSPPSSDSTATHASSSTSCTGNHYATLQSEDFVGTCRGRSAARRQNGAFGVSVNVEECIICAQHDDALE